ncbi:MAG: lipopolysaccharide biosynthesis protein [Planctomycetota bacterium]
MAAPTSEIETLPAGESAESGTAVPTAQAFAVAPAIKALSLKKNFLWTFAGNAVYAGCQWGMLIVLAKLGSKAIVGQFALGLAVTAPAFMLSNLQLRAVQATDARGQFRFDEYLSLRLLGTLLTLVALPLVCWLSGYGTATALVICAVGLAKGIESISDVIFGLLQHHERMDRIAISMMLKGPLSLAALGLGMAVWGNLLWATLAMAAAWLVVLLSWDVRSASRVGHRWSLGGLSGMSGRRLMELAWLALPLGVVTMLFSLNVNIPRYVLEDYLGEAELGIFAALAALMLAGNQVINALGQSASPRLAKLWQSGSSAGFLRILVRLLAIGLCVGLVSVAVAWFFGQPLLTLLYSADYAAHWQLLVWLMLAATVNYLASFMGYAVTAARSFRMQAPVFTVVVVVTTLWALWDIPRSGLLGGAHAVLAGQLSHLLGGALLLGYLFLRRRPA